MKFIRNLLARSNDDQDEAIALMNEARQQNAVPTATPAQAAARLPDKAPLNLTVCAAADSDSLLEKVNAEVSGPETPVKRWDMDGEEAAQQPAQSSRRRRNKTRLLGYEHLEDDGVAAFDKADTVEPTARAMFPVGWVVVADGPGRGTCFTLEAGMSQIGRGDDQAIQLDFGDNSISRTNHAAIVYDPETHEFLLGHGGKKNIVRLNGKPVISNEALGLSLIHISEPTRPY